MGHRGTEPTDFPAPTGGPQDAPRPSDEPRASCLVDSHLLQVTSTVRGAFPRGLVACGRRPREQMENPTDLQCVPQCPWGDDPAPSVASATVLLVRAALASSFLWLEATEFRVAGRL